MLAEGRFRVLGCFKVLGRLGFWASGSLVREGIWVEKKVLGFFFCLRELGLGF